NLQHVTAAVGGGLIMLTNSQDAPYQMLTELTCTDTIVVSSAKPPLVEQRGPDRIDEYLARLQWSGQRDFFNGVSVFWQIANTSLGGVKQMAFADWQELWPERPKFASNAPLVWKGLPQSTRPFHAHTPSDYALDTAARSNPAVGSASDGLDAGCIE